MNSENVILGKKYACFPVGIKNKVIGEVVSKLENCVIFCVEEYDENDHLEILEKAGKVVAKYSDIYELTTTETIFQTSAKVYTQALVS
ncbi:hypothetical protein A5844_000611 [Enterococcus sp. 10A9_DIV0425]|uniref:Uncharacterized protein n=1 Tax=Candidatus Enterococcus wittei TaxID=1987383 RepID=A0A2C9XR99_9ENTE|nr:hypothetical protein [Enterococcus sp. 10A9_DIV0425]OTP12378.1 hypothetical protein A5844_000611 [Enterococcus sp. 10A9_DIV0425]THE12273.1 hypothetical protein E1H99_07685 [Enterococcus hirae]